MKLFICLLLLSASQWVSAENTNSLGAHTHGEGLIHLIFDGNQLHIELKTPAANLLGFEHSPTTPAQQQTLEKVAQILHHPQHAITLTPNCKLTATNVVLPYYPKAHSEKEHNHHHSEHRDIYARYQWQCSTETTPKIHFNYFTLFPNFKIINVEWIANGTQGLTPLNKHHNILSLVP